MPTTRARSETSLPCRALVRALARLAIGLAFALPTARAARDGGEIADVEPVFEDELTLFAIPAPRGVGLDWKRPGRLTRQTLINEGFGLKRGIGHAGVRVRCAASEEAPAGVFQGSMTSTGDEFRTMVLDERAGLGVLFRTVPGALETEAALQESLDERYRNGRVAYLRMGISPETCHALLAFARTFDEQDVDARYGFVRPLHGEGAGCSAFSMAFLHLAGLVEPFMREEWTFDVRIPLELIGGETNPGNRVRVTRIAFLSRGWAKEDEPHLRLNGWDPTRMFHSIRDRARTARSEGSAEAVPGDPAAMVERRDRAWGIALDRRDVPPTEALSAHEFFLGEPEWESDARFLTIE